MVTLLPGTTDTDGAGQWHHGELPLAQAAMETVHFRVERLLSGTRGLDR